MDLYRAKYRHADFTPYAWCFHGNEAQEWNAASANWVSTCKNNRLKVTGGTSKALSITAPATYKFVSLGVDKSSFWRRQQLNVFTEEIRSADYDLAVALKYTADGVEHTLQTSLDRNSNVVLFNMSEQPWASASLISRIVIEPKLLYKEQAYENAAITPILYIEYIKVDQVNVLYEAMDNDATIVTDDLNQLVAMANNVATTLGATNQSTVAKLFVDTLKAKDLNQIIADIRGLPPYNGCATCDSYTCSCNSTRYGYAALAEGRISKGLLQRLVISLIEDDDFPDELKLELLESMGG